MQSDLQPVYCRNHYNRDAWEGGVASRDDDDEVNQLCKSYKQFNVRDEFSDIRIRQSQGESE